MRSSDTPHIIVSKRFSTAAKASLFEYAGSEFESQAALEIIVC